MTRLLILVLLVEVSCATGGTRVVKPRTHKVWPAGNKYLIDIPVGARHIRIFERKRIKKVRLK